jgi:hypothetical protein
MRVFRGTRMSNDKLIQAYMMLVIGVADFDDGVLQSEINAHVDCGLQPPGTV